LKVGLPFDEQAYGLWGTQAEIEAWSFKKWWEIRGKEVARRSLSTEPEIVEKTASSITIRFPLTMPSQAVKARASALVAQARGTKRIYNGKSPSTFHYAKIKQLQRFLKIDLDARYAGYTLEKKGELLKARYQRIGAGHAKAVRKYREKAEELQNQGDKKAASRYRRRAISLEDFKAENIDSWNPQTAKEILDLSPDKLGRWAVQARLILFNVARGEFPGSDWYGNRRNGLYKKALSEFGLAAIGSPRNKGGATSRGVEHRKKKASRRIELGARAYGRGRGDPVGDPSLFGGRNAGIFNEGVRVSDKSKILTFPERRKAAVDEAIYREQNRQKPRKPRRNFE
jgi:hypothetical protein